MLIGGSSNSGSTPVAAVGLVLVVLGADGRIRRDYVFIESST
jgi:hypothetical protein